MANEVPVGITLPYSRGENNGFFAQTYSMLERAKTNLKFLLMTAKGERPMMPTYGSDLRALLFNPNTPDYVDELFEDAVVDAAESWMSEVTINSVVTTRDAENAPYVATLNITFSVASIPDSEQDIEIKVEV